MSTIEVTAPGGEVQTYELREVPIAGGRSWELTRVGRVRRVCERGGHWSCTCESARFGTGSPCKHVRALQGREENVVAQQQQQQNAGADLARRLAEPFDASEVKWKAQVVRNNRALAVAYIDARVVEDRLDEVFGPGGWQDSYLVLQGGGVVCTLSCRVGGEWVSKSDVGSQSDQPDEGDRAKAAFSDALKRAAVKWGVGRYLYRVPHQWVDYDAQAKQLRAPPGLPDWACPGGKAPAAAKAQAAPEAAPEESGGPEDFITAEQWAKLKGLLSKAGVSQAAYLKWFEAVKPSELRKAQWDELLRTAQRPPADLVASSNKGARK